MRDKTPSQIGDVVGVDRMDSLDRQKLDPRIKLQLLAAETKIRYGRDPRSGGMQIVGRPRVILQLLMDMKVGGLSSDIRLERPIMFGTRDADVVGHWEGVPIVVRSSVVDDRLWCLPIEKIPPSSQVDRQRAGQLRVSAHAGRLEALRED